MVVSNDGGGHVDNSGGGDCINDTDSGVVMAIGDAVVDDAGEVVVIVVITDGDGHWGGQMGWCNLVQTEQEEGPMGHEVLGQSGTVAPR